MLSLMRTEPSVRAGGGPSLRRRRWQQPAIVIGAALAVTGVGSSVVGAVPAAPGPSMTLHATTVTAAAANATTVLDGYALSGAPTQTLEVTVSTDVGTLSMTETENLTLAFGYSSFTATPTISFTGLEPAVNAGLASLALAPGTKTGVTAHVGLDAYVAEAGLSYSPSNQHFYKYVADPGVSWTDAQTAAATQAYGGQAGYLATIPSAAVNNFVADNIEGASNVWFGAHAYYPNPDTPYPRVWQWTDGPLVHGMISECTNISGTCAFVNGTDGLNGDLYSSWAPGEPNNSGYSGPGTGEDSAVTNWRGTSGKWNDLSDSGSGEAGGYLVEFGDRPIGSSTPLTSTATSTSPIRVYAPPSAPTGLTARASDGGAVVSWDAAASNGGWPITASIATASPGGATCSPTPASATSCTIRGLLPATRYTFTVAVSNGYAVSSPSVPFVLQVPEGNPTVGITDPAGGGYLIVTLRGNIGHWHAGWLGSPHADAAPPIAPIVGMAAEPGGGYVVATDTGVVYNYTTGFYGSPAASHVRLAAGNPVVGIAAGTRGGYLLVTRQGDVFAYHTARHGSPALGHIKLRSPVVGITSTPTGGYLIVTAAGNVYAYGTIWRGSPAARAVKTSSVIGMAAVRDGAYVVVTAGGHVYAYGMARIGSSLRRGAGAVVAVTATRAHGYDLATSSGRVYRY
jgi:hypothetical protein